MNIQRYRLRQRHSINGRVYAAGAIVDLPQRVGDWLVAQNIADAADGVAVRTPAAPAAPEVTESTPVPAVLSRPVIRRCCGWSKS